MGLTSLAPVARTVFWIALAVTVYVYAGYPLVLAVWRRLARRPIHKRSGEPTVSLIVCMRNEARNVVSKMKNCEDLDYPRKKLQVIVSLDAPQDGTDALVANCAGENVKVIQSSAQAGKAVALNRGVAAATGEILVLADARQRFEPDAIRELVANFADPAVGGASGELMLLDEQGHESVDGAGAYWRYEKRLRAMESDIHSVPGATGSIFAMRRELFRPLPAGTLVDDVLLPMRIVLDGHRVVFDPAARAYDVPTENAEREYERKRRTLAGNYQLLAEMPELLAPWRNPIYVQFISHKVGRLLVPYCLAAMFFSNALVLNGAYLATFIAQVLWYGMAAAGWLISTRGTLSASKRLALVPYLFVLLNWAAVAGLYRFVRGLDGIWTADISRREAR